MSIVDLPPPALVRQPDLVDQVLQTFAYNKQIKKRIKDPSNMPHLIRTRLRLLKEARRIEKVLLKMGYNPRAQQSSSDDELAEDFEDVDQSSAQISPKFRANHM